MNQDPLADFFTQIRNALQIKRESIEVPASRLKVEIARVLKEVGKIKRYETAIRREKRSLKLIFNPPQLARRHQLVSITRMSKPSRRLYAGHREIPKTLGGVGITLVSTPKGILTDVQARKLKVGGEVLCQIY